MLSFLYLFYFFLYICPEFIIKGGTIMFGLGGTEILVIALVVLLLFGGKKIPELMKGLGTGVKSFKDGMKGVTDVEEEKKEESNG